MKRTFVTLFLLCSVIFSSYSLSAMEEIKMPFKERLNLCQKNKQKKKGIVLALITKFLNMSAPTTDRASQLSWAFCYDERVERICNLLDVSVDNKEYFYNKLVAKCNATVSTIDCVGHHSILTEMVKLGVPLLVEMFLLAGADPNFTTVIQKKTPLELSL